MKIVFFGEDSFSVVVLESLISKKYEVLRVYSPFYENNIFARLQLICEKQKIEFVRVDDINSIIIQNQIIKLSPDLIVVTHFEKVLKKNIIDIPKYGCINLHPSILPNYRGLSPQHWPIINGDQYTGITVHYINEGIDTGDIIVQRKIQICQDDYVSDLQMKMKKNYGEIIIEAINKIDTNKVIPINQNDNKGSYYGKLNENHCKIDVNGSVINAFNLIRGVSFPYIGANYKNYKIWRAKLASVEINKSKFLKFKENDIYFDADVGNFIKFKDGLLIIEKFNEI